jgi:hypothetical protein
MSRSSCSKAEQHLLSRMHGGPVRRQHSSPPTPFYGWSHRELGIHDPPGVPASRPGIARRLDGGVAQGRVALGGNPPRVPTDPDMPVDGSGSSGIELLFIPERAAVRQHILGALRTVRGMSYPA